MTNYQWNGKELKSFNNFKQNTENIQGKLKKKKKGTEDPTLEKALITEKPQHDYQGEDEISEKECTGKNWSGNHEDALLMEKSKSTSALVCQRKRDAESEWWNRGQVAGWEKK